MKGELTVCLGIPWWSGGPPSVIAALLAFIASFFFCSAIFWRAKKRFFRICIRLAIYPTLAYSGMDTKTYAYLGILYWRYNTRNGKCFILKDFCLPKHKLIFELMTLIMTTFLEDMKMIPNVRNFRKFSHFSFQGGVLRMRLISPNQTLVLKSDNRKFWYHL